MAWDFSCFGVVCLYGFRSLNEFMKENIRLLLNWPSVSIPRFELSSACLRKEISVRIPLD